MMAIRWFLENDDDPPAGIIIIIIMCGSDDDPISFECLNSLEKSSDQGGVPNFRDKIYFEKTLCPNCCLDDFVVLRKVITGVKRLDEFRVLSSSLESSTTCVQS